LSFRRADAPMEEGNMLEFHVIHTNWYWRRLRRILRFGEKYYLRVHPDLGEVRACHEYKAIAKMIVIEKRHLVLHYNETSSPDFFRAAPKDIKAMTAHILSRTSHDIEILYQ